MQVQISVVIITFNEERNIERCLLSVKSIADEIVVLDSFSTDATEPICRKHGVQFYQHAFDGHIEQKNRAITYASSPFILSLDADEALDETLQQEILKVKKNWTQDAYKMNRLTNYCGKWIRHSGWYPDTKLRLWNSRKGAWGGVNPHDCYEMQAGCTTAFLKGNILHYSYYTIQDHYKQIDYFSSIAANALYANGVSCPYWKIILKPIAKFLKSYVVKTGFLDGLAGFTIARLSAIESYRRYKKLQALWNKSTKA